MVGSSRKPAPPYQIDEDGLSLRDVRLSDVTPAYVEWVNDPEIVRYLETRFATVTARDLRAYVAKMRKDPNSVFLAMILKGPDRHIGNIKVGSINWIHGFADLGLIIGEKHLWGHGYATQAIRLATDFAFDDLGLRKVFAACYAPNEGSKRAFEKAGFAVEGVLRQHYEVDGKYVDGLLLGRLREEPGTKTSGAKDRGPA